jgi:type I restriction enzyme S subunit
MVEWKKLVSVADVLYGYPFESSQFSEDSIYMPLIRIRDVKPAKASTYYSGEVLETYRIMKGDILVGMDGEFNLGKWNDRDGLLNQRVLKLKGKDGQSLDGYLFHYMGPVFKKIEKETAGGSVKHLSAKVINNIQIPIPSLPEQTRIVGILDTFTAAIDNLKEQIAERRKQYEHYRDQLLDLEGKEDVEMKKLGEVCDIKGRIGFRGYTREDQVVRGEGALTLTASNIVNQRIDYTNNTYITWEKYFESPEIMVNEGDIIVCQRGSIGKIAIISGLQEKATINPQLLLLKDIKCNNRFLIHYLLSRYFQDSLNRIIGHGTVQMIAQKDLKELHIPLLDSKRQQRIVSILDTFEASIQNLEAQLKEREKQYEYYRNKLLTFE